MFAGQDGEKCWKIYYSICDLGWDPIFWTPVMFLMISYMIIKNIFFINRNAVLVHVNGVHVVLLDSTQPVYPEGGSWLCWPDPWWRPCCAVTRVDWIILVRPLSVRWITLFGGGPMMHPEQGYGFLVRHHFGVEYCLYDHPGFITRMNVCYCNRDIPAIIIYLCIGTVVLTSLHTSVRRVKFNITVVTS